MMKSLVGLRIVMAMVGAVLVAAAPACSGGDDGGVDPGDCADVSGTWDISGECGQDFCVISQTGCATAFECGTVSSYSGSISGNDLEFSGTTRDGVPGMCSGTVAGDTMSGTCTVMGLTCGFTADRQ